MVPTNEVKQITNKDEALLACQRGLRIALTSFEVQASETGSSKAADKRRHYALVAAGKVRAALRRTEVLRSKATKSRKRAKVLAPPVTA